MIRSVRCSAQMLSIRQTQSLSYGPHCRLDLAPLQLIQLCSHHNKRHVHIKQSREHRPIISTRHTARVHPQHPQPELASLPKVLLSIFLHALLHFLAELGVAEAGKVGESQNGFGLSSMHIDVVAAALWSSQQGVQVGGDGGAGSFPHLCGTIVMRKPSDFSMDSSTYNLQSSIQFSIGDTPSSLLPAALE